MVLLDNALSAVDHHTAQHIFEHAVRGMFRDKATILVTHQVRAAAAAAGGPLAKGWQQRRRRQAGGGEREGCTHALEAGGFTRALRGLLARPTRGSVLLK